MKSKILVTGGDGRFASVLKNKNKYLNLIFKSKRECNILNLKSVISCIKKNKPSLILHCAGLSRPMNIHDRNISKSIDLNIIGTANVVKACKKFNIKIIYLSSGYVYEGKKGNYSEKDGVKPFNNYGWSKLGGECAVQMYKNSLILRVSMTEKPFIHKYAFKDLITNFIFHEDVVKIFPKLIKKKGIINLGGKTMSVFKFAKQFNKNVKGVNSNKLLKNKIPLKHSMSLKKLNKILND